MKSHKKQPIPGSNNRPDRRVTVIFDREVRPGKAVDSAAKAVEAAWDAEAP